ncbi:hypothetical protein JMUB3936_1522 [Leptotrichia wadei]|uniref:Uncharacterized protein n=1 Tax=Leptotrichia wadei TaxID=157687 RepID=A0A510KVF8_9FUSO|nr:hypothetical protein JMUB3936_1522 [Leptotrichia wadei]
MNERIKYECNYCKIRREHKVNHLKEIVVLNHQIKNMIGK